MSTWSMETPTDPVTSVVVAAYWGRRRDACQGRRRPLGCLLRFVSNCSRRIGVTLPVPLHSGHRVAGRAGAKPSST